MHADWKWHVQGESIFVHVITIIRTTKKEHEPLTEMHAMQVLSKETNKQPGLNIDQGSRAEEWGSRMNHRWVVQFAQTSGVDYISRAAVSLVLQMIGTNAPDCQLAEIGGSRVTSRV